MSHNPNTVPGSVDVERRLATISAGFGDDQASLADLRSARGDHDPLVRSAALGALLRRGALSADAVIEGLSDASALVRQRAAQLAPEVSHVGDGGDDIRLALRRSLHDPVALCVVVALEAIGAVEDADAIDDVLEVVASTTDPLVHEEAVATLASLGDPRGLPVVLAASLGKPAMRRRSVAALGAFEGTEVEAALDRLAEDRDWQVRQAVAMLRREELDPEPPQED